MSNIKKGFLFLFLVIGVNYFLVSCDDMAEDGDDQTDSLVIQIPIINLKTDTTIYSKEVYVKGVFQLEGDTSIYSLQIKGRGNSTWNQPKKPYKIKFDSKIGLFAMPTDKEYALLANYLDKSLLRNDVAFELSQRIGMAWTPRRQFVDLYLNGNYQGNYLLTETVKTGKDRLNITLMEPKKQNDTLGSFIVEADSRHDALQTWTTSGIGLDMKDPDSVSQKQLAYVIRQFENITKNMDAHEDMRKTLNLDTWIKWLLVNEVMRNRDATLGGSCYFYKDTTGKIAMGPVWDFDLSSGAYKSNVAEGWYVQGASWFSFLMPKTDYYKPRMKEIWNQYKDTLSSIGSYIDKKAVLLEKSQTGNYKIWDINQVTYTDQYIGGSYKREVDSLKSFLSNRIKWLDSQIQQF